MDKIINDIFSNFEVRKSKKQKKAFREYTSSVAEEEGYSVQIEKGPLGAKNIVVGNPNSAKVIYTAHYDTCAKLPFPNFLTPKNIGIYILYNIAIVLAFFVVAIPIGIVMGLVVALIGLGAQIGSFVAQLVYIFLLLLMFIGPANKHTANDNTSGVTVLFGIMKSTPAELRDKVAFVFFDHEEIGLIGSGAFARKHKNIKKNTLLLNFDCVSDGKNVLLVTKKGAIPYTELLSDAFASQDDIEVSITDNAFYPSDQAKFKLGVGVAAFNKTKRGMLYMNKIHTKKDTVYRRENIDFLVGSAVRLVELI